MSSSSAFHQESSGGGAKQPSTGCGCASSGSCSCPPNRCTCPNCPREQSKQREMEKQSATKPGELSGEARKMPDIQSSGLDIGKPNTHTGKPLDFSSFAQFPSESDYSAIDSSLKEPLHSLVQIRDCLLNHLKQGNFNEENAKSCVDHLDHWEGKYRSKEGVYSQSAADFSSSKQTPKGQEVIGKVIQQIHQLHSVISQRLKESTHKEVPVAGGKISGQSSLMEGAGYSKPQSGSGEISAEEGGMGTKKDAQLSGSKGF